MVRAPVLAALAALVVLCSPAAAAGDPPAALVRAVARTAAATSMSLDLTERIQAGSQTITVRMRGVDEPQAHTGSFALSFSPAQPGLGQASEIVHGSRIYVHYAVLDTLHARNPSVKSWVAIDSHSTLGIDPAGAAALGDRELREMTGIAVVGHGKEGGVPVTRYRGTLDLRRAAASPQLQQLLAHLPSAAAAVLRGKEQIVISVGDDGYVHRETSTIGVAAAALRIRIDVVLGEFGRSVGTIAPPAASEVMTLAAFDKLVGLPAPGSSALLQRVVLRPSQVGAGYVLSQIPGGQLVQGERTLDFCNATYPSESLRTARLQVEYRKRGAAFTASNEVVTYEPGGAKQALGEVAHAAAACPNGAVKNPPSGVTHLVRHTRLVTDRRLLPGAVAVLDLETGIVNGKRVTENTMAVYQVRGNVLSGVYGSGSSPAAIEKLVLRAAERSAANLRRVVGASGTPTA